MKTSPVRYHFKSSFEFCMGRGFRVRSFTSEFDKSFHDRTSLSANDMKFLSSDESPLKVRKIAVYRFLISFLVPELLRFKELKKDRKNCAEVWVKFNQNL